MPVSSRIAGLSEIRRLPRLGKIRLGIKIVHKTSGKEYPREVSYFVVPPEVAKVYGEKPTRLDILFPLEDEGKCFPQNYKRYTKQSLRCKGDGQRALCRVSDVEPAAATFPDNDPNALVEVPCPCRYLDSGECSQAANLMVILPRVNMGGIWQVDTGSFHNIVRINSAIDYVRALVGRIALVPMVLTRQEEEIEYEGKKAKHYLLQCTLNADIEQVARLRADARMILMQTERLSIPAAVESGPEPTGSVILVEDEPPEARDVTPAPQEAPAPPAAPVPPEPQSSPETQVDPVTEAEQAFANAKTTGEAGKIWNGLQDAWETFTGEEQTRLRRAKDKAMTRLREKRG